MSRRSKIIRSGGHDGTSQRGRALPALDPGYAAIDERSSADLLAFVQKLAKELRYFTVAGAVEGQDGEVAAAGTWEKFAKNPDLSIADMVAYIAEPERFTGERARWLGRPHFALLLAFLELLGHARAQLNELTARHLDYFYREVLKMQPEPAQPDSAAVVFRLANRAAQVHVPAGTALEAGRDSSGAARIYRTERALIVNRAEVVELRSVFVHRRITGIADVREDLDLTADEAFDGTLRIALGVPGPGDPIPSWNDEAIDAAFFRKLRAPLDIASTDKNLYLAHHELRALMRLVRRRDAGEERADAEWAEINRLLELAGRRKRKNPFWRFATENFDPTAFENNLQEALDNELPAWPWSASSIRAYEHRLRELEAHLSMPIERIQRLAAFAGRIEKDDKAENHDWTEVDRILADAHREQVYAARRAVLAEVRGTGNDLAAFEALASFVLSRPGPAPETPKTWEESRKTLADSRYLDAAELGILDRFYKQLETAGEASAGEPSEAAPRIDDWSEIYQVLELAQRYVEAMPEPVACKIEWRNLHAYQDARTQRDDAAASPRWKTFGGVPDANDKQPPATAIGWALRSPILSLSQGTRTLTLTLGFEANGLDDEALRRRRDAFIGALGLDLETYEESQLPAALAGETGAWRIQASTAKGWIDLDIARAKLATGVPGDDYWSVRNVARALDKNRPALQLELIVDRTHDPITALPGMDQPTLRVLLRPHWDDKAKEWTTLRDPFEPLRLAAVHLHVAVDSLTKLALQNDDRVLDPRKPFEPFGRQPMIGSRLYMSHPELIRARLDTLRFHIEWMGLPASLASHYANYPADIDASSFKADIALLDRNLELPLAENTPLFTDDAGNTRASHHMRVDDVPAALPEGFAYTRRSELPASDDLQSAHRCLRLELRTDFGHTTYPSLAATKVAELSVQIAKGQIDDTNPVSKYQVNPPYTPTIKHLRIGYTTAIEIDLGDRLATPGDADLDRLVHLHPFGETAITAGDPWLLPRYDRAGELYIGLRGLEPPEHVSLLVQLAEGTSDPDIAQEPVSWSCLDGDHWRDAHVLYDSTRGLINSGIVELALPEVAPSARLPGGFYWVRVAIPRSPTSVCDAIDIRAQAVTVCFEDRDNAADHYARPLPAGSITRLVEPDARIAAIDQPFTSFAGQPPERPENFHTRVSERLRHKQRAMTPWDYERLVLQRFAQIYKAKCLRAASEPGRVDVIVILDIRHALPGDALAPRAPADLLADIQAYLCERAPEGVRVRVRNAHYVPVMVRLGVRFVPGIDERFASKRLNDDLVRFLSPWAYDEGAELMIGGRIYATSILDFVDRRDYVVHAVDIKLYRGSGKDNFTPIPATDDYHVATDRPDQILVAARHHDIDVIPELGYQQELFTGIEYMKLELDFIVGE